MKILIAEDDATSGLLLKTILTKAGYEVERAIDGKAALECLEKAQYDALLTDWMMPRMDGIQLIHHARQLGRHRMPIIVVTALVSEQAKVHALTSGADG
jgi:DNA-binding response OmpR family regulator